MRNLLAMDLRAVLTVVALLAGAIPSLGPGSAAAADIPTLGGTNILRADGPASLAIRVPAGARIDTREHIFRAGSPNKSLSFQGQGAFVGLVLQQEAEGGFRFVAGRWDSCEGACDGHETFSYTDPTEGDSNLRGRKVPRFLKVPPGDYRIYLISGGGPVAARFDVKGLKGELASEVTKPASVDVQSMPERLDLPPPGHLWSAGSTFESGKEGFFISNLVIEAPELRDVRWGICGPNGPTPPPEEVSYGPQCTALAYATGSGFFGTFARPEMDRNYFLLQFSSFYDERVFPPNLTGERGLGTWFSTPSDVRHAAAQAAFISFE